ncbi:MAG: Asp-tRNA(Asn)/Glu-tRNA(Gln) amidotransferase subunit GatB [Acidobacteria bacterium]|nr:Asp-tRNA(Asn)/Glu-tRNA(Gln) amidotransferase subunit GatB [Acidobacteriota bacterium]
MDYEAVIGLEIHAQLATDTKIFCGCSTRFGAPANTHVCPVCLGMPGVLPVLNARVVEQGVRAALALGCTVHPVSVFARKNYFYPDLPKGYQISQFEEPLATEGTLAFSVDGEDHAVGIVRVHLEEDAGKSLHEGFADSARRTYLDFNRSGVPLIEIVTRPDLRAPAAAAEFFQRLRALLMAIEVNDGNMEEGSLRCDANVSVRPAGETRLGTKVEVKNINSFRFLQRALEFEIDRQTRLVRGGGAVVPETRLWDSGAGRTASMRSKEEAHDYRYFPEPDLPPLRLAPDWIETVRAGLPELPEARRRRYVADYGLADRDAAWLARAPEVAAYFEAAAAACGQARAASHWIQGPLTHRMKADGVEIAAVRVSAAALAELIGLVESGAVNGSTAKDVFERMWETGRSARAIVDEEKLSQIGDADALGVLVDETLAAQPDAVVRYRAGKTGALGFLVGQVMRATRGQANPQVVNALFRERLERGD